MGRINASLMILLIVASVLQLQVSEAIDALGVEELARRELEEQGKDMRGRKLSSKDHGEARRARVLEREEKLKRMAEAEFGKARKLAENAASRKIPGTDMDTVESEPGKPQNFPERNGNEAKDHEIAVKKFEEEIERRVKELDSSGYDLEKEMEFGTLPDLGHVSKIEKSVVPDLEVDIPELKHPTLKSVSPIDELHLNPDVDYDPAVVHGHADPVLDIRDEIANVMKNHELPDVGIDLAPEIPEIDNDLVFKMTDIEPPIPEEPLPNEGMDEEPETEEPTSDAEELFQAAIKAAEAEAAEAAERHASMASV